MAFFLRKENSKTEAIPCSCRTSSCHCGPAFSFSFASWSQSWDLICTVGRRKRAGREGGRMDIGQLSQSVLICTVRHFPRGPCPNPSIHPNPPTTPVDKKNRNCVQQGTLLPTKSGPFEGGRREGWLLGKAPCSCWRRLLV